MIIDLQLSNSKMKRYGFGGNNNVKFTDIKIIANIFILKLI